MQKDNPPSPDEQKETIREDIVIDPDTGRDDAFEDKWGPEPQKH